MAENATALKPIPERLYKYKSLQGESRRHVEQMLRHSQIYFCSPSRFIDPFDSRVHLVFPEDPASYRRYVICLLRNFRPDLGPNQRKAFAAKVVEEKQPEANAELQKAVLTDLQRHVDSLGVFCLSERGDDILMWSHYAGGHSGVCLQFENCVGLVDVPKGVPLDVSYSEQLPVLDFVRDSDRRQAVAVLLTKAARWAYEGEWRIVDPAGPGLHTFAPDLLSGVIFGCRTSEADRRAVQEWIAAGATRPQLYEATVAPGRFALETETVAESPDPSGL